MDYIKNNYKNFIILLIGLIILAFGGFILVASMLGGDSLTVFNQGIATILSIDYGYGMVIGNLIFIIFILIFNRKTIGVGTVAVALLVGPIINLFLKYIPISSLDNKVLNHLFSFSGLVLCSLGLAMYMYSNTGLGGFESFVSFFAEIFNLKFGIIKIIIDAILFTIGVLMGGVFGITSILSVFLMGPLIEVFLHLLNKTNFIKKENIENELIQEKSYHE